MTFPRDKSEGMYEAEDHSVLSIVLVSFSMIAMSLVSISIFVWASKTGTLKKEAGSHQKRWPCPF